MAHGRLSEHEYIHRLLMSLYANTNISGIVEVAKWLRLEVVVVSGEHQRRGQAEHCALVLVHWCLQVACLLA
jgi:hypothetical protein